LDTVSFKKEIVAGSASKKSKDLLQETCSEKCESNINQGPIRAGPSQVRSPQEVALLTVRIVLQIVIIYSNSKKKKVKITRYVLILAHWGKGGVAHLFPNPRY
jgi:hypothetical protein